MMGLRSKIADLGRLHEIIKAFSIAGFGDLFKRMGLEDVTERTGKILGLKYADDVAHLERPQRLRRLFEVLGPTFVKLGQILATRPDLFGPEWITEFEKLQSQAPPLDFKELRPQIEHDLGAPLEEIFEAVDTKPLAAASLAQVHRATLKDGTQVILKIQRPGIRTSIESDMHLLSYLASLAEKKVPELATYHPQKVVQQFVKSLQNELNFITEGQNAEQVAANFEGNDRIVIPKVYWEWTRERIIVQQFVDGIPGVNIQAIDEAGMDRKRLAQTGAQVTGLDLSPEMLEIARAKSIGVPNICWVHGDMRTFELGKKFGLILIPGHSFQFMLTPSDQAKCLENIRRHLLADGTLVIHVDHQDVSWLGELLAKKEPAFETGRELTHPDTGQTIRTFHLWTFEPSTQTATVMVRWEGLSTDQRVIDRWEMNPLPLHCVFRFEMEHLLRRVGFSNFTVYGDFSKSEVTKDSSQMIWVVRNSVD